MVAVFKDPITADEIKEKATSLGADIVGIADSAEINRNPPDPADRKSTRLNSSH